MKKNLLKRAFKGLSRVLLSNDEKAQLLLDDVKNIFAPIVKAMNARSPEDENGRSFRLFANLDLTSGYGLCPPEVSLRIGHLNDKEAEAMNWYMTEGGRYAVYRGGTEEDALNQNLCFIALEKRCFYTSLDLKECFKENSMVFFGCLKKYNTPPVHTDNFSVVSCSPSSRPRTEVN